MAVLRAEFDNILCFNDFIVDFTYPKKLVKSSVEGEFLKNFPNIKYKKVNILIGTNASGKTSLGKAIWKTFVFLRDKEANPLRRMIADENRTASILLDCVFEQGYFYRLEVRLESNGDTLARYRDLYLNKDDSYKSLIDRLPDVPFQNHTVALDIDYKEGWNFRFPSIESGFDYIHCKYADNEQEEFLNTFQTVLKTFDPSIDSVFKSVEQEDTYIIKLKGGKTVSVKHGEKLSELHYLSSGTKYAINIANVICSIKNHTNGFYYVDEQFSYVNSEIEIACLTTMIDLLGDGEQLIFTTHNEEIMELPLPIHSFSFMRKKEDENGEYNVELINASSFEKRNNVNVKNLYDNDYFDVFPDTKKMFDIVS